MKRLVIYFHYDPAGRIDTACRIAVQAMQKYAKVLFVTNGTLTPADRVWVRQAGAGRIERDNTGFDVGAYKEALLTLGREKLAEYEEVILMNFTLAGPVRRYGRAGGTRLLGTDAPLRHAEPPLWWRGAGTPAIPLPGAAAAIIQQRRLLGLLAADGAARKL